MKKNVDKGVQIVLFAVILNAFLFILKGSVGMLTYSTALQADAVNSAGDTMTSLAVFFGVKYAIKPHDDDHHYGHGKMEALISLVVGAVILVSAGFLWRSIFKTISSGDFIQPNVWALAAAVIAIIVKIYMYIKTIRVGKKLNSIAVMTNAKDHRNDIFATGATVIAISASLLAHSTGIELLKYAEPAAAAVMSIFIIKTGLEIIISSSKMLMDAAPDKHIVDSLKEIAKQCEGVEYLNWLKCRSIGRGLLVDVAVEINGDITVEHGHALADNIKHVIQNEFSEVLDVLVHINPHDKK